ncbi:MAG TPA: FAD-dependent oxidoreductase [Candidatus Bathyarchaeia archaeon]|nr:FAD-dependent oxidoreductase [Candidatus Bathyarchaeia archaeon]
MTRKMWSKHPLKSRYHVVIIGAGVHGLSVAYHLAKRGITDVAVLDRTYLGGGNSGRNTQIIRANQRMAENVLFYDQALKGWESLSQEVNFNMLIDQVGLTTLGHNVFSLERLRLRAETNKAVGVESLMIGREKLRELFPYMDLSDKPRYPILGALYHPRGGVIRHDAVVWGYASASERNGVEIHPHTEVEAIRVQDHQVTGVSAAGQEIACDYVVNATAGWCSTIAEMVGIRLPIISVPLQAAVTEPLKPVMTGVIMSGDLAAYFYQTDRGEFVMGGEIDPYAAYSYKTTLPTLEVMASAVAEIMPCLANINILRSWGGICDITPDFSPIMCESPEIKGFILDCGWGTYGFKTAPAAGNNVAELIRTGEAPDLIKPFTITRFYNNRPVDEKASAGTAH